MSKRKGAAKRRRRKRPKLTDEQRIALEVSRHAAENRRVARQESRRRRLLEVMDVEDVTPPSHPQNDLTRWELVELQRINEGKAEPRFSLPASAYEATRLMHYVAQD